MSEVIVIVIIIVVVIVIIVVIVILWTDPFDSVPVAGHLVEHGQG